MENKPDNCIVWGERSDTHKFYAAADLFLFTSKLENRPLSVIEALGYNLNTMVYNMPNYSREFAENDKITFLTSDINENIRLILKKAGMLEPKATEPVFTQQVRETVKPDKIFINQHLLLNILCVPL
jgi:glycosyltransferase involved in cell wall biosynthesis